MHFTGMAAVVFHPNPLIIVSHALVAPETLAIAIAAIAFLIIALGLVSTLVDNYLERMATGEAERLRRHIRELETTKLELVAAKELADAGSRSKSEFLANMSHELRTPLNAIIGFSDFMLAGSLGPIGNPRYLEYITDIQESGCHLLQLVNDILDLSSLDAGQRTLQEQEISIEKLLSDVKRMVVGLAHKAKVKLLMDASLGLCHLFADERRVRQIVLNLRSNAIKFTI
jgi:signal transduction histidine kinase